MKTKFFKWVVEFEVAENWVADGFDLNDESAKEMIENDLRSSFPAETRARVIKAPSKKAIRKTQGYTS